MRKLVYSAHLDVLVWCISLPINSVFVHVYSVMALPDRFVSPHLAV